MSHNMSLNVSHNMAEPAARAAYITRELVEYVVHYEGLPRPFYHGLLHHINAVTRHIEADLRNGHTDWVTASNLLARANRDLLKSDNQRGQTEKARTEYQLKSVNGEKTNVEQGHQIAKLNEEVATGLQNRFDLESQVEKLSISNKAKGDMITKLHERISALGGGAIDDGESHVGSAASAGPLHSGVRHLGLRGAAAQRSYALAERDQDIYENSLREEQPAVYRPGMYDQPTMPVRPAPMPLQPTAMQYHPAMQYQQGIPFNMMSGQQGFVMPFNSMYGPQSVPMGQYAGSNSTSSSYSLISAPGNRPGSAMGGGQQHSYHPYYSAYNPGSRPHPAIQAAGAAAPFRPSNGTGYNPGTYPRPAVQPTAAADPFITSNGADKGKGAEVENTEGSGGWSDSEDGDDTVRPRRQPFQQKPSPIEEEEFAEKFPEFEDKQGAAGSGPQSTKPRTPIQMKFTVEFSKVYGKIQGFCVKNCNKPQDDDEALPNKLNNSGKAEMFDALMNCTYTDTQDAHRHVLALIANSEGRYSLAFRLILQYMITKIWSSDMFVGFAQDVDEELVYCGAELKNEHLAPKVRGDLVRRITAAVKVIVCHPNFMEFRSDRMKEFREKLTYLTSALIKPDRNVKDAAWNLQEFVKDAFDLSVKLHTSDANFVYKFPECGEKFSSQSMVCKSQGMESAVGAQLRQARVKLVMTPVIIMRQEINGDLRASNVHVANVLIMN